MIVRLQAGPTLAVLGLIGVLAFVRAQPTPTPPALPEDDRLATFRKASELEAAQNYAGAVQLLQGVPRERVDYSLDIRLGWLHYCAGNQASAVWHYEQASIVAPQALEPRVALLLPLLAQERYAEVERVGRGVLSSAPDHYLAALRLTYAYRMQGKLSPADQLNDRMLILYPSDVSFLLEQAAVRQAQGRAGEARGLYRRVLLLAPNNAWALQGVRGS